MTSSSNPTILVLGVTGKVGLETERLLTQTADVCVIAGVGSPEKAQQLPDCSIEIRRLDLDCHDTLAPALNDIGIEPRST